MASNGIVETLVDKASSEPVAAVAVLVAMVAPALYWFTTSRRSSAVSSNKGTTTSNATTKLKNVWDTSRKGSDSSSDKKTYSDKPFGSTYYYAHNNSGASGGYKDGLRMEDYTMNGPRLLSKGGKPVSEPTSEDETVENGTNGNEDSPPEKTVKIFAQDPNELVITKYLWDDPGDGIATIRIEKLPEKNGSFVDWKDVRIESVQADLAGEGLLVKVVADQGKYRLKINKLYGDAASVKAVIKPKRLLLKIKKKVNAVLATHNNSSNMDAWPRPHRTI